MHQAMLLKEQALLKELKQFFQQHKWFSEILLALGQNKQTDKLPIALDLSPDGGCDFLRCMITGDRIATLD